MTMTTAPTTRPLSAARRARPLILVAFLLLATSLTAPPVGAAVSAPSMSAASTAGIGVGDVTPEQLVDRIYLDLLNRRADAGGREYWASQIASGTPVAKVIKSFIDSREVGGAYEPTIRLYRAAFLRPPDPNGLAYWLRTVRAGAGSGSVANVFATSTEFTNRYGTLNDTQFVDRIYRNVLRRPPDRQGLEYWVGRLNQGMTRGEMLRDFAESIENMRKTSVSARMSLLWITLLKTIPGNDQVEPWTRRPADTPTVDLINEILESDGYRNRLARLFPNRRPLTGQYGSSTVTRPALAIKIDNVDQARPHVGLNLADVVYEEMVEGTLTRLIGVYHSQAPRVVGPVRSIRVSDFDILAAYNRPLLAASGANSGVLAALNNAPVVNVNALVVNEYWRDRDRRIPHNMMTSPAGLWSHAPGNAGPPPVMFTAGSNVTSGDPRPGGVSVEFGRATIRWRWDAGAEVWRRTQNGTAHLDSVGRPIGAENVIVMVTRYVTSSIDAESPEAKTVGKLRALIFTDGTWTDGYWERGSATEPIRFHKTNGDPIVLRPGQTWIELAPPLTTTLR